MLALPAAGKVSANDVSPVFQFRQRHPLPRTKTLVMAPLLLS